MAEGDRKPINKKGIQSEQNEKRSEIINLMKELHHAEMKAIKDDIEQVKAQIAASEGRLNVKLDQIDVALRGNTSEGSMASVGLFEQHRRMRMNIRIIAIFVLLLYGARLYGLTLGDFVKNLFFGEPTAAQVDNIE